MEAERKLEAENMDQIIRSVQKQFLVDLDSKRKRQCHYATDLGAQVAERVLPLETETEWDDSEGASSMKTLGFEGTRHDEQMKLARKAHAAELLAQRRALEIVPDSSWMEVEDDPIPPVSRADAQRRVAAANRKLAAEKSDPGLMDAGCNATLPESRPHTMRTDFRGLDKDAVRTALRAGNQVNLTVKSETRAAEARADREWNAEQNRRLEASMLSKMEEAEKRRSELVRMHSESLREASRTRLARELEAKYVYGF